MTASPPHSHKASPRKRKRDELETNLQNESQNTTIQQALQEGRSVKSPRKDNHPHEKDDEITLNDKSENPQDIQSKEITDSIENRENIEKIKKMENIEKEEKVEKLDSKERNEYNTLKENYNDLKVDDNGVNRAMEHSIENTTIAQENNLEMNTQHHEDGGEHLETPKTPEGPPPLQHQDTIPKKAITYTQEQVDSIVQKYKVLIHAQKDEVLRLNHLLSEMKQNLDTYIEVIKEQLIEKSKQNS